VEFAKDEFLHRCSGFIVPGQAARTYLRTRKISDAIIYTAPNAVDNDFYMAAAADARKDATRRRRELHLPERYFLFVGRLVQEKGVFELLSAYATLSENNRRQVGLVFVGDGVCRPALEQRAAAISAASIVFSGFTHREQLASYYALADTLVLPTYSDTWGLVVNEAMACGLPVILTEPAGCAADLVKDNWNGLLVPPKDPQALAAAMQQCVGEPGRLSMMGANSAELIRDFSPEVWSLGIMKMMGAVLGHD
jgi:glycosyltransferase involved in cell wall biosynthesis